MLAAKSNRADTAGGYSLEVAEESLRVTFLHAHPFPTSWHQPESDFNQVHILRGVMLHRGERKWQTIYKTGSGANYSKHKLFLEEDVCK